MNAVTRTMAAGLLAIVALIAGALMDGPSETQAAQDVADYSAALADGGVSMCKEFDRVPVWTKAGNLVFRMAGALPVVAQGEAL